MKTGDTLESIPCPICGNINLQKISEKGQFGIPCFVSICPSDGLVFLSPRWSKERYMHFYQYEYDSYYRPNILTSETEDEKYKNVKTVCSRLEKFNPIESKESVLDIGAGMGWSLHWIKNNYPNFRKFSAIESSDKCISNLKNVVGADIISNDIDSDWKSNEFGLVILRHVLEHVMNPLEALKKIAENLAPDGILYIAVPDMMHPKGSLKKYWYRTVHTYYFSEMTLLSIASQANLEPIALKSENSELWGIFKKATNSSQKPVIKNVYDEQMMVIKDHARKNFIPSLKQSITQSALNQLPKTTRSWLINYSQTRKK